jgi:hypothetical protein
VGLLATVANAGTDVDSPSTPGYGTKVLDLPDLGYAGYGNLYTSDESGSTWTIGTPAGGGWSEHHMFYAYEVPTGSAIKATGDWRMALSAGSFWA